MRNCYRALRFIRRSPIRGYLFLFTLLAIGLAIHATIFYFAEASVHDDLTWFDAFYYSVVSVTTIGFGDISPQTPIGRAFLVFFLAPMGLVIFGGLASFSFDAIVQFNLTEVQGLGRSVAMNHIIIVHNPGLDRLKSMLKQVWSSEVGREREIVLLDPILPEAPYQHENFQFVRGNPLDPDVWERVNLRESQAVVVVTPEGKSPLEGDSITASVITVVEHLAESVHTVVECQSRIHQTLFEASQCDMILGTKDFSDRFLVQEALEPGLVPVLTDLLANEGERDFFTCRWSKEQESRTYRDLQKEWFDKDIQVIGVLRKRRKLTNFFDQKPEKNDEVVLISRGASCLSGLGMDSK